LTELATAMNVSRWTVDRWKKHGYVFKFGRQTTLADCKQWLAKNAERLAGKVTRQEMEEAKRRLAAIKSR
jgi:hypothetical protein